MFFVDFDEFLNNKNKKAERITNFFYSFNLHVSFMLDKYINNKNIKNIIDVGCGSEPFKHANYFIDFLGIDQPNSFRLDIDYDVLPFANLFFDFCYCRHTLEDIQNPLFAFEEMTRISKKGYIETPSPMIEISKGVVTRDESKTPLSYRGYPHHRYIVWSDVETNTLYCLPKFPIVEHLIIEVELTNTFNYIANNHSILWNNYYMWDEHTPPNIYIYRNGINMTFDDYVHLLVEGIKKSIEYTNNVIIKKMI